MRLSICLTLLCLSACSAIPNAQQDMADINLPQQWSNLHVKTSQGKAEELIYERWWTSFEDAKLNYVIETALQKNNSLQQAAYSLQQSLLQVHSAIGDLFPSLSANANASSSKSLEGGPSSRHFGSSANISFQLDVFGKLLKNKDAKQWLAQASMEDRQSVAMSVSTQTADLYWQLAHINKKLELSQKNIEAAEQLFKMVEVKYKYGAAARMDLLSSEQSINQQRNTLKSLQHQHEQIKNALAVMIGEMPQIKLDEPQELSDISKFPVLQQNIPAEVLDNRPDIRAARLRLMADMANVSVRVRDFFPSLNLGASATMGGSSLSKILSNPQGALSLGVALPFLNVPDNIINLKVSQIQYQADLSAYKNKLYTALSEVENAHSQYRQLMEQHELLEKNLQDARQIERMRMVRYQNGADSLQDLLNAQTNTRQAEQSLLDNELALHQNFLTRYNALGGKPLVFE